MLGPKQSLPCIAPLLTTAEETLSAVSARVRGHIPEWLNGYLLRVGPGKFEFGKDRYNHWFDGMALLHQFRMERGTVTYKSKFLQSDTYKANSAGGRIVISEFGTLALPDPCKSIFERFMSRFEPPSGLEQIHCCEWSHCTSSLRPRWDSIQHGEQLWAKRKSPGRRFTEHRCYVPLPPLRK